jgi:hypothetical protein
MTTDKTTQTNQTEFDVSKIYLWVKSLESKVNNLLREVDLIKNDLLKKQNDIKQDIKSLGSEVLELQHQQTKTFEKMDLIIQEIKKTAGIEEVMIIKKYLEYWNPTNFVTQNDLNRAVENKVNLTRLNVSNQNNDNKKEK